jgi:hypothetical protein
MNMPRHFPPVDRIAFVSLFAGLVLLQAGPVFASSETGSDEPSTPDETEPDETSPRVYVTLGLGGATFGIAGMLGLSFESGPLLISTRVGSASPLDGGGWVADTSGGPDSAITDYSALVGWSWHRPGYALRAYAEAGVGMAKIERRQDSSSSHQMSTDKVVNLPLQVGAAEDWRHFGFGLAVIGNVNTVLSDVGAVITLRLGWL